MSKVSVPYGLIVSKWAGAQVGDRLVADLMAGGALGVDGLWRVSSG